MYLLDTGVVSELRNARAGRTDPGLTVWASRVERQSLFISAITLLELESGAAVLAMRDPAAGAARRAWISDQVMAAFAGRILAVDVAVVRRRGAMTYASARDGLIAATALEHGLTLVTRNAAAFRGGKVKVFNPWGYAPEAMDEAADWGQAGKAGPMWLKNLFVRS